MRIEYQTIYCASLPTALPHSHIIARPDENEISSNRVKSTVAVTTAEKEGFPHQKCRTMHVK